MSIWPFEKKPRDVQLAALETGLYSPGFAYFMRQRMGKTGTILADFEIARRNGDVDTLIVIAPNSLKGMWADAITREWQLPVTPYIYEASRKHTVPDYFKRHKQRAFIINYESLSNFHSYETYKLYDPSRAMIVADQSTYIKNYDAMCTKAALKLAPMHKFQRVLAGKPTSNSNLDLWAQLKFIQATGYSYYGFRNTFTKMGGFKGKEVLGDMNTELLKEQMSPYVFIAGDEYLAEFEPKIYAPLRRVEMTDEQKRYYKEMQKDFFIAINEERVTAPIVLTQHLRLQQITSGFATAEDGSTVQLVPIHKNPRLNEVYNLIKEECENKVIVAARFKTSIEWLQSRLKEFDPIVIKGNMKPAEIEEAKRRFNTDNNTRVCIGQIDVIKMGHLLSGPDSCPCDTVIFYENDFSLITRSECEARADVMNRKVPIEIVDLYSSPMDQAALQALRRKEDAALALMGYARQYGVLAA